MFLFGSVIAGNKPAIEFSKCLASKTVVHRVLCRASILGKVLHEQVGDNHIGLVEVVVPRLSQGDQGGFGKGKAVRIHESVRCASIVAP